MRAYYEETFKNTSNNAGTNAKKIVTWLIEKTGLTIVETKQDQPSVYTVYLKAFDDPDVLLLLECNNGHVYFYVYTKQSDGSTTIGGVSGYKFVTNLDGSVPFNTENAAINVKACVTDSCLVIGINNYSAQFLKLVDMCSSLAFVALRLNSSIWRANTSIQEESQASIKNGYVVARPIVFYAAAIGFLGQLSNPLDFVKISSNGTSLSITTLENVYVGGHNFVSLGNGYFVNVS